MFCLVFVGSYICKHILKRHFLMAAFLNVELAGQPTKVSAQLLSSGLLAKKTALSLTPVSQWRCIKLAASTKNLMHLH